MWRPNDWKNPYIVNTPMQPIVSFYGAQFRDAYEAGADAILKALKGIGQYLPNGAILILPSHSQDIPRPDWLVFIPEEK